jgi:hypothetical protein
LKDICSESTSEPPGNFIVFDLAARVDGAARRGHCLRFAAGLALTIALYLHHATTLPLSF